MHESNIGCVGPLEPTAVLCVARYDMEDACILNKSSVERGFAHGRLIKTEMIDLTKECGNKQVFEAEPQSVSGRQQEQQVPCMTVNSLVL